MTREQLDSLEDGFTFGDVRALIAQAREALELREALEWFAKHGDALDSSGYGSDDKWWECIYNDGKRAGGATPLEAMNNARRGM